MVQSGLDPKPLNHSRYDEALFPFLSPSARNVQKWGVTEATAHAPLDSDPGSVPPFTIVVFLQRHNKDSPGSRLFMTPPGAALRPLTPSPGQRSGQHRSRLS